MFNDAMSFTRDTIDEYNTSMLSETLVSYSTPSILRLTETPSAYISKWISVARSSIAC